MQTLERLKLLKGSFGAEAARRVETLLVQAGKTRLQEPSQIIDLHEILLFFRAYPQSKKVAALADAMLKKFSSRVSGAEEFADPEVSGIAGTTVSTNFSHEFAETLVQRHGKAIEIDWENFARPDRLGPVLASMLPAAAEAWTVEPHIDWEMWFKKSGCTIAWLLEMLEPRAYDLLEIPLIWKLGNSSAARTHTRIRRPLYVHGGPLLRRKDVSIATEFSAPRIVCRKLPLPEAYDVWHVIVDTSAVRYRELWGFLHPDLKHLYHADFGRGVDFYFSGLAPDARLPLRAYHSGMFFKNGVPLGYFEGLSLFGRMEAGFNLYYTFRDGETAWLYVRTMKLFRERLGIECFSIDPYQIGHENEEAIESGAFWFYRKLGFRPASPDALRLAETEERKLAANPAYRTAARTLRKLAESPMLYGESKWAQFSAIDAALRADQRRRLPWPREVIQAKYAPEETGFLKLSRKHAPK